MVLKNGVFMVEEKFEEIERISTGITGLDNMIEGGFEKGSINLVAGDTGTGKSILSLQFLYNKAKNANEPGIYITFEEKKDQIIKHMKKFGMDFEELEKENKILIYEYSPREVSKFIDEGGAIENVIRENSIKNLVLDSITSFAAIYPSEAERRKAIISLLDILKEWGCTCLLPSEAEVRSEATTQEVRARFGIEYLSDSLIALYSIRKGDIREMALEIVKMRGTNHSKKLAPMKITNKGIILYPDQPFFSKSF